MRKERVGELIIMIGAFTYALFPIFIVHTTRLMPPILFAATSVFVAAIASFVYIVINKQINQLFNYQAFRYILGVTIFIIIIPGIFIYIGSSKTSGINTTILLQSEIFFTFLIVSILGFEKINLQKFFGAVLIATGTILIISRGDFQINIGDLLILTGVFFFPIGNIFAKKALILVSPSIIIFLRSIMGGIFLLFYSFLLENYKFSLAYYINANLIFIILNGFLVFYLEKVFWYEGIKRLELNKAVMISLGAFPVFGLFLSYLYLEEIPTGQQWLGFLIVLLGLLLITLRNNNKSHNLI